MLWYHRERPQPAALGLDDLSYESGRLEYESVRLTEPISVLPSYLDQARELVAGIEPGLGKSGGGGTILRDELETLRWFPLP